VKGAKEFESEREKLIREHGEKKAELKRKYLEEEVELEKAFDACLTKLMEKYSPSSFKTSTLPPSAWSVDSKIKYRDATEDHNLGRMQGMILGD